MLLRPSPVLLVPLALLLNNCGSEQIYPQHPLAQEILSPRPGHEGKLTNQSCLKYEGENCTSWSVKDYDLSIQATRDELNNLGFICKIVGKRYKVCKDSIGFCRMTYQQNCFLGFMCGDASETIGKFPMTPYQNVLDANVKCFNEQYYDWEAM